jgi:hypothetical protein
MRVRPQPWSCGVTETESRTRKFPSVGNCGFKRLIARLNQLNFGSHNQLKGADASAKDRTWIVAQIGDLAAINADLLIGGVVN